MEERMRTGAELVRASNAYTDEDVPRTWRLLLVALFCFFVCLAGAVAPLWLPIRIAASLLEGLVIIRLFIFYHDYLHGALLRNSRIGAAYMRLFGWLMLTGVSVWRQTHDYHHKNNAKMLGASIGSFPIVSVDIWRKLSPSDRRDYRIARSPITMLFGYFTVFILGMCISPFRRNPRQHLDGLLSLIVHFATMAVIGMVFGWTAAFLGVMLPMIVACSSGSYLFYAQHNFPSMKLKNRQDWEYSFAALNSSSMFDMSPLMHWFTGNIGYHHVHHLNHRIPFYRLPEAMAGMPELQQPGRVEWSLRSILSCLAGNVWDPAQQKMVSYAEADQATPEAVPAK
jgi:omega-6 fatty acid desaturase (delta-12 desaturase)